MLGLLQRISAWIWDQWAGLGRAWQGLFIGACAVAFTGVTVASYKSYEYTEHSNAFCTSCHLMDDAYSRFKRSAHSKIECHDCHKATVGEKMHQVYATLVQKPREVSAHAYVPNTVCEACHVQGDSSRWRQIANTAGHRIHLESKNPALKGMQCIRCHGVNLHEFASVDRTCGQAGCHVNNHIRLGAMSQVELHCTTCHSFLAEAPGVPFDSLGRPLTPRGQQCLGCHAMQQRIVNLDIGRDPHRGVCGDCHNPHTQTSAKDVTCTSARCHVSIDTVSFHKGIPHPDQCTRCHEPHSWRVNGANCTRCHQNILREWRRQGVVGGDHEKASAKPAAQQPAQQPTVPLAPRPAQAPQQPVPQGGLTTTQQMRAAFPRFSHGVHQDVKCSACHSSTVRHGQLVVRSVQDCQRCHHAGEDRQNCIQCHAAAAQHQASTGDVTIPLAGVQRSVTHRIRFEHQRHASVACTRCHTNGVSRAPDGANCAGCHEQHHGANANCSTCHTGPATIQAHSVEDHTACATCHGAKAADLPKSRAMCLVCHAAQVSHVPGRVCENCHHVTARG